VLAGRRMLALLSHLYIHHFLLEREAIENKEEVKERSEVFYSC
jgi:hypothetical protein